MLFAAVWREPGVIIRRVYIFVYLPPYGASAYTSDEDNGILLLESYINQVELKFPNTDLLVSGDFNARTKDCPDFIIDDSAEYIPLPDDYEEDRFSMPRNSKDLHGEVNIHGKSLLNLCCTHNIHMLNGRIVGDLPGHLTCFYCQWLQHCGLHCSLIIIVPINTPI